jgi:hypothetical protein
MNDKWFNIGMILILTSIVANGFILMLVGFPNSSSGGINMGNLYRSDMNYGQMGSAYNPVINEQANISDTASSSDGSGFTPITLLSNIAYGLTPLYVLIMGLIGLELLLITLASIFTVFSIVIYTIVGVMLMIKFIIIAYFASILVRLLFGGRS